MLKVNSYSAKGLKLAAVTLPKEWEAKANDALLAQAMHVYQDRGHIGLHQTKTRGEINRTTKKWYKQKGTGGARHGARSAPIFVGGGVAHGPRAVARELTLPEKMRRKAVAIAISMAAKEDRIIACDTTFKKTSEAQNFIEKIVKGKEPRMTFIVKKENMEVIKFVRNIKNVRVLIFPSINAYDISLGGKIIFDKSIFEKEKKETSKK